MNGLYFAVALVVCASLCAATAVPGGPGSLHDADESSPQIKRVARFATKEIGSEYRLNDILRAQTQVVEGTLYVLKIEVFKKTPTGRKYYNCRVQVLSRPWLEKMELMEFHCTYEL